MSYQSVLLDIKTYLSNFVTQIKLSNSNSEFDLNIYAESMIIPLLNVALKNTFKNVNLSDKKNAQAIDLISEDEKVAIQVTSTREIDKIKKTIEKLLKSKYKQVKKLYIYILTDKQLSYSQIAIDKVTKRKFNFNTKTDILDYTDLYKSIYELNNLETFSEISGLLKRYFSDVSITDTFKLSEFRIFKEKYKNICKSKFSRINFFGLSISRKPREVNLSKLYVEPKFKKGSTIGKFHIPTKIYGAGDFEDLDINFKTTLQTIAPEEVLERLWIDLSYFQNSFDTSKKQEWIDFDTLFSSRENLILIGNPGAGKSLMIKYAFTKILTSKNDKEDEDILPFRVELHKYHKAKKSKKIGIIDYLLELLKEEYQLELSKESLTKIFENFPTYFFFDGLDEIFDVHDRLSIRDDIESFLILNKESQIIVTSRFESYEEVNLDERYFRKYEILDFDDNQVADYITKWYLLEELDEVTRENETRNCLEQLKNIDPELKYNPLLLSLITILYREQLDIPTSKLEIYENCTNTIADFRDSKEKQLGINLHVSNKTSVFAVLANWQFNNGNALPNYDDVKIFIKNYLLGKGEFGEENTAVEAATQFLDFAKLRSIYIENKFTHKTFSEYYMAYYLFSSLYSKGNKDALNAIIAENLGLSSWSVVFELLITKIDTNQSDFEIIDSIISRQLQSENLLDALVFFLQILKHLRNVSPKMTESLISKSISKCFVDGLTMREGSSDYKELIIQQLVNLIQFPKYKHIIESEFANLLKQNSINDEKAVYFAYEFAILSGKVSFIQIIQELNKDIEDDYVYVLKSLPLLSDKQKFLHHIKLFSENYSIEKTQKIFKSKFDLKIFFGSKSFNWNINYLLYDYEEIISSINDLNSLGINNSRILASLKTKSVNILVHQYRFLKGLSQSIRQNFLAKLVSEINQTYFFETESKESKKFYDKFYKRRSKR